VPHEVARGDWRDVLDAPVEDVAPRLLGAELRRPTPHGWIVLRLTEVEAYGGVGEDPGSHAFRGPGRRNATMFGPPGRLYVYFTYGMHWCANVVCGPQGSASAVLLRAGEVVEGVALARQRRPAARKDVDLARGPARLTQALGIDGVEDGVDLDPRNGRELWCLTLRPAGTPVDPALIRCGPRVGVSGPGGDGEAFPWRFSIDGEPSVSMYRPGKPRRRPAAPGETLPADVQPSGRRRAGGT
jgi:DNA-3-methyladenine glycosylase